MFPVDPPTGSPRFLVSTSLLILSQVASSKRLAGVGRPTPVFDVPCGG